jgi:hypothetical protein
LSEIKVVLLTSKKLGSAVTYPLMLFSVITTIIMVMFIVQFYVSQVEVQKTQDALAASSLAVYKELSVLDRIDVGSVTFSQNNCNKALSTFKKYLRENLSLGNDDIPMDDSYISGRVKIYEFIIYDLIENDVTQYTYWPEDDCFGSFTHRFGKGNIRTPNDKIVDCTSVYTSIGFDINILGRNMPITISQMTEVDERSE